MDDNEAIFKRILDDNEAIFKRILDDPEFREVLMDSYAAGVCRKASKSAYRNEDDPGNRRTTTLIQRCSSPYMRGHGGYGSIRPSDTS